MVMDLLTVGEGGEVMNGSLYKIIVSYAFK